jgi:transmembrane sensor
VSSMHINRSRLRAMTPDEAAAFWLVAREDGGAIAEHGLFEEWLNADQKNQRAWSRMQAGWDDFSDPHDDELLTALHVAALEARPFNRGLWKRAAWASGGAAVAAALLVLGVEHRSTLFPPATREIADVMHDSLSVRGRPDYVTERGQRSLVDLPDGSKLTLDADTAVDVVFSGATRATYLLRGRAFFDVAHNPRRPFVVHVDDRTVTALGTSFDVRKDTRAVQVILVNGRVAVGSVGAKAVTLKPGERFVGRQGAPDMITPANIDEVLDWKRGFVEFNDTTLSRVVVELNRYTTEQIVIHDPRIAGLRVSGRFRTGDTPQFERMLSDVYQLKLRPEDNRHFAVVRAAP